MAASKKKEVAEASDEATEQAVPSAAPEGEKISGAGAAAEPQADAGVVPSGLDLVLDVPVRLTVEIGGTQLYVREVLQLDKGSVIELDRMSGEPADILVNGRLIGRGEVTVVDDRLAVRIVEFAGIDRVTGARA